MKKFIYFATALAMLAGCTNDEFIGDPVLGEANGQQTISFGFEVPTATRASGSDAADALGKRFIVYGEKSETQEENSAIAAGVAPGTGNYVFPNYQVNYVANSAYTSTSNTKGWEYVGYGHSKQHHDNIKTKNGSAAAVAASDAFQTIKYWDYNASNYVFTAVSADSTDVNAGKVVITKNLTGTTVFDKGYTIDVTDEADLTKLFFADRVLVEQSNGKDRTAPNAYGGNVTFTFRNAISKVRVGMYETIPGYSVKVTQFYYVDDDDPTFGTMTSENTTNFVANVPNMSPASGKTSVAGTFTVKYYEKNTANDAAGITNHPTVSFTPTANTDSKNFISLGAGVYNTTLAETSATPTYDQTAGAYTTVFPQEGNDKSMKLKIDYQLSNSVTGETINITGKTAEVPAKYLQWKPNFKYTYLFKITDDDLYPITFDAVVIEAEDGQAEYITTVTEPSITTFGVNASTGKYVYGSNEYAGGSDIYATFMEGSEVKTPVLGTNVNVYYVTSSDASFKITEASVAESLAETSVGTKKIICANVNDDHSTYFTAVPAPVTTVPGEDGSTITIDALKLTGVKKQTLPASIKEDAYAVEYITYDGGTLLPADTPLNGYYSKSGNVYTELNSGTADGLTTYYKKVKVYI